jgi:hypothetical protein
MLKMAGNEKNEIIGKYFKWILDFIRLYLIRISRQSTIEFNS